MNDIWWPLRVIPRIRHTIFFLLLPFRALELALNLCIGLTFVAVLLFLAGIATHNIPLEWVAAWARGLGGQFAGVLRAQGVY